MITSLRNLFRRLWRPALTELIGGDGQTAGYHCGTCDRMLDSERKLHERNAKCGLCGRGG